MASSDPAGHFSPVRPVAADVMRAAQRMAGYVARTPLFTSTTIDEMVGAPVYFKCENLQRSGSFKLRGAISALTAALEPARARGVVTHSSGNHAAALALAARLLGVRATVVMPETASAFKRAATVRYGARVIDCGPTLADRETALAEYQASHDALFVPPYDHPDVIAGQGTVALELLEDLPGLSAIWLPVGGGGLASGCALVGQMAGVDVRGGEPLLADDAFRGLAAGERQPAPPPRTVADGLRTALGVMNFDILRDYRLSVTRVSEAAILDAQRLLMHVLKLVVEPSSAVALAALLESAAQDAGDRCRQQSNGPIAVVLSGGNVDLAAT